MREYVDKNGIVSVVQKPVFAWVGIGALTAVELEANWKASENTKNLSQ